MSCHHPAHPSILYPPHHCPHFTHYPLPASLHSLGYMAPIDLFGMAEGYEGLREKQRVRRVRVRAGAGEGAGACFPLVA